MTLPPKTQPSPRAVPATALPPRPAGERPSGTDRRPVHIVMFAVIACGLLVAAAFVIDVPGKSRKAGDLDEATLEPGAYAMQATGDVSRLGALPALPEPDVASIAAADRLAASGLQEAIDQALSELQATLDGAALPAVPTDYVAGAEVEVDLPAATPYPLPTFSTEGFGVAGLRLPSVTATPSPVAPRSGGPADDVLAQLEGLQAQLEDLIGESPVEDVLGDGLPGPVGGLPLGGGSPEQVQDAGDAVDPDEEGAVSASLHAQGVLGLTGTAYGSTASDLESLLQAYEDLAQKVEDAIEAVRAIQEEAEDGISTLLQERLDAIEDDVERAELEAAALVRAHAEAVAQAHEATTQAIDDAVASHSLAVAAAGDAVLADLESQAVAIQADAEQRKADIQAIVDGAVADLGTSPDAQQALQAVQAAAAAATLQVEGEAESQLATLQEQADGVRSQVDAAQARLQATATGALDGVSDTAEEALAGDELALEYLVAVAQAQGALLGSREAVLAADAVAELEAMTDEHVESLVDAGVLATQQAEGLLDEASDLVADVEGLLISEVGKDIDYVADVSEDYGRVPTEDRKARATHWSSLATSLGATLEDAVLDGQAIEDLAGDVLAAAAQAEAEISAMA